MGTPLMFDAFCLIWWIMESPIYDLEELVELVMRVSLQKHFDAYVK